VVEKFHRVVPVKPVEVKCPRCEGEMCRMYSTFHDNTWKPVTLNHIDVEHGQPKTFETRKSLKDYCNKHGLHSGAL